MVIGTGKWSTTTRAHKGLLVGKSRTGTGHTRPSGGRGHRDIGGKGGRHKAQGEPGDIYGWTSQGLGGDQGPRLQQEAMSARAGWAELGRPKANPWFDGAVLQCFGGQVGTPTNSPLL